AAMSRVSFSADLRRAAAFAHRMNQPDPIAVDDPEYRRGGQEDPRPVLMGREEAEETRAFGEAGEQGAIVACQPAIEGPVAPAFEGMEQPQGDHFTGPEVGLGVFGEACQMVINLTE